jgi:glutathione S-transferase
MPELEIIGGAASNYVWVCRMACAEKGVSYKLTSTMPHTPEVDAIHPLGKIPVMRHGDVTLAESRAICCYIDRAFAGPALLPADIAGAARVEQWISLVNTAIDPVWVRQYLAAYFFPGTQDGSPNRSVIEAALPKMQLQMATMDRAVAQTGHLVGSSFTLADMNFLPILHYMNRMPESGAMLAANRNLKNYLDRHAARPSMLSTTPSSAPGQVEATKAA